MRSKIRYDLLFKSQKYAKLINNPIQRILYDTAYKYIKQMRSHIVKPFQNICIHGNFPQLIIPTLQQNKNVNTKFWTHSFIAQEKLEKQQNVKVLNPQIAFNAAQNQQNYDLIISCLQGHHYDMDTLIANYTKKLNPDGAIIGCCWAQNTLKELNWAFMLAQNQRSGGISPKVLGFPSLGSIGHAMTTSNLKLPTIVVRDYQIQVNSVVDILTLLQAIGESGILKGKRKGVFKDVLLAACAYYDSQFTKDSESEQKNVTFSLELGLFVAWKQHESQPKPLSRRQIVNNSFFSQLMKDDKQSKMFIIKEGNDQPQQINIEQVNQQSNNDKNTKQ